MRYWRKEYGLTALRGTLIALLGGTVLVLALFAVWETKVARTRRAIDALRCLGGRAYRSDVCFDNGIPYGDFRAANPTGWLTKCARAFGAQWLFDVVHVDFRGKYTGGSPVTDADLVILAEFPSVLDLDLSDTEIGDQGMKHLVGLGKLRNLDLRRTRVTDLGLLQLTGLKDLEFVELDGTSVKGWGVDCLKRAVPGVYAGPMFESDMADWRQLLDKVDKFREQEGNKRQADP